MAQIASLKTSSAGLEAEKESISAEAASAALKITELEAELTSKTEDHAAAVDSHSNEAKNLK